MFQQNIISISAYDEAIVMLWFSFKKKQFSESEAEPVRSSHSHLLS